MEVPADKQHDCPICGTESPYVLHDDDKMCSSCGHVPGVSVDTSDETDEHDEWREHRRENYSGWYGDERIKFVGGFVSAYNFGEDFDIGGD